MIFDVNNTEKVRFWKLQSQLPSENVIVFNLFIIEISKIKNASKKKHFQASTQNRLREFKRLFKIV